MSDADVLFHVIAICTMIALFVTALILIIALAAFVLKEVKESENEDG